MPSRIPPMPPESDERQPVSISSPPSKPPLPLWKTLNPNGTQPVSIASPPLRSPPPPWKLRDADKRPSIQIDTPLRKPPKYSKVSSEHEQSQTGSRGSKRPITQRVFRGYKKFIDSTLSLSRSGVRKDSAYSFTPSQIDVNHTQTGAESIKEATRAPPMSPSQSNLISRSSYRNPDEKGDMSTPSSSHSETRTNSVASSRTSKADSFLSKATPFKLKSLLPRIMLRKDNVREDTNGSEASPCFPAIEKKYWLPELDFRSWTLLPFQCTMCFRQLDNKVEWIQHEQGHNDDDDDEDINDWYWRCGICENILHSWDDRQNHIVDEHFEIGQTLSCWNSSTSPFPWNKRSSKPISGFPHWDISVLRSMQHAILDDVYR